MEERREKGGMGGVVRYGFSTLLLRDVVLLNFGIERFEADAENFRREALIPPRMMEHSCNMFTLKFP